MNAPVSPFTRSVCRDRLVRDNFELISVHCLLIELKNIDHHTWQFQSGRSLVSLNPLWLDRIIVNSPESRRPAQVLEFVQYLDTSFGHTVEVAWLTLFILVLLSYVYRDEILVTQYDELVEDRRFALLNVVAELGQVDCSYIAGLEIHFTSLNFMYYYI